MSNFESNPFADPHAENPFADPSIRDASGPGRKVETMEEYNPFAEDQFAYKPPVASQPAVLQTSPPAYTPPEPQPSQAATDYLQRRQEELERKAAELDRREREIEQNVLTAARVSNFPPLPARFPVKPCFYQDISVDIPLQFQKIVRLNFYYWIAYSSVLFLNVWVAVAYFAVASGCKDMKQESGTTLGLSILYFILWTPASYIFWFRAVYNAFRIDSSFFFFAYFFVYFMQFCANVVQCIGIKGSGTVGYISGIDMAGQSSCSGATGMGVVMIIVGGLFTALAVFCMMLLIRVHRIYRGTGGNFAKAQEEFAHGVITNRAVQQTASGLAASAAQGAAQSAFNNYGGRDSRY